MIDEVRTLRTAIARTATQGESATEFRGRLEKRAASLLASRPIFLGIQQVAITADDPVEPKLYARYAAFLAQHGAGSSRQPVAVAGNAANAKCATCHAEYVSHFEGRDLHFKAMQTLRRAGKANDPFCMSCHITPLAVDASRSIGEPQAVEGVQCQWCHQSAEQHASSPYAIKPKAVTNSVCMICHNENQSPKYAWDRYVPRLSCYAVKRKGESRD